MGARNFTLVYNLYFRWRFLELRSFGRVSNRSGNKQGRPPARSRSLIGSSTHRWDYKHLLATPGFSELVFVCFYGLWWSNSEPHLSKTSALLTEPSSQHTLLLFILVLSKFCSIMTFHRVNFSSGKSTANNSTVCLLGLRPGSGRFVVLYSNSRENLFSCLSSFASHHLQPFSQPLLSRQRQTAIPILLKSPDSEPFPAFPS